MMAVKWILFLIYLLTPTLRTRVYVHIYHLFSGPKIMRCYIILNYSSRRKHQMYISIPNSINLNEVMNVRSGTIVNAMEAPQLQFNVEDI